MLYLSCEEGEFFLKKYINFPYWLTYIFSLFETMFGGSCWQNDRMRVFFVTSSLASFLKPETLSVFLLSQCLACIFVISCFSFCRGYRHSCVWTLSAAPQKVCRKRHNPGNCVEGFPTENSSDFALFFLRWPLTDISLKTRLKLPEMSEKELVIG